jgi:hypothetical protein
VDVDLLAEVDHHAGLRLVAAESHLARQREILERIGDRAGGDGIELGGAGRPGAPRDAEQDRTEEDDKASRADRHRAASPPGTTLTH